MVAVAAAHLDTAVVVASLRVVTLMHILVGGRVQGWEAGPLITHQWIVTMSPFPSSDSHVRAIWTLWLGKSAEGAGDLFIMDFLWAWWCRRWKQGGGRGSRQTVEEAGRRCRGWKQGGGRRSREEAAIARYSPRRGSSGSCEDKHGN